MCTPTSTSCRPPVGPAPLPLPPSSQRTLRASSTSVHPGGSMLQGGEGGEGPGMLAVSVRNDGNGLSPALKEDTGCNYRAAVSIASRRRCPTKLPSNKCCKQAALPAHQVLWPAQVAPRRQLSRRDDILRGGCHRRQLTQRALATTERGGAGVGRQPGVAQGTGVHCIIGQHHFLTVPCS